jgi:hypothetical protein
MTDLCCQRLTPLGARSYAGSWHGVPLVICPAGLRRGERNALKRPVETHARGLTASTAGFLYERPIAHDQDP